MPLGADSTRILMLHRVLDDAPAAFDLPSTYRMRGTAITRSELARVVEEAAPILPLDAVELALARGEDPPVGAVLTFDDGYREHLDVVAPLLSACGASATFYVTTGIHGAGTDVAVVDAWYWVLDHATEREARVSLPNGGEFRSPVDTLAGKRAWVGGDPKAALLAATARQQAAMIAELAASAGCSLPADLAARLYLRPNEWSSLVRLGMRIGAHSVRHPRLTQVDDEELHAEVHDSVDAVRSLGTPVAFAYPDGAHDARVVGVTRTSSVSSAVTCEPGVVRRGWDSMRLPRFFVTQTAP
jgi:peptidoglycan/xylan/chitin deacetylase (PgdA/CDA1 family)